MTRLTTLVAALTVVGCTTSLGRVGVLQPDAERVGVKLLRPGVVGRSCRTSVVGLPLGARGPELNEALGQILALDPEGDVVTNTEIRCQEILVGLYNRRCIEVRGDLARTVSTLTLPAPPEHHHHP